MMCPLQLITRLPSPRLICCLLISDDTYEMMITTKIRRLRTKFWASVLSIAFPARGGTGQPYFVSVFQNGVWPIMTIDQWSWCLVPDTLKAWLECFPDNCGNIRAYRTNHRLSYKDWKNAKKRNIRSLLHSYQSGGVPFPSTKSRLKCIVHTYASSANDPQTPCVRTGERWP